MIDVAIQNKMKSWHIFLANNIASNLYRESEIFIQPLAFILSRFIAITMLIKEICIKYLDKYLSTLIFLICTCLEASLLELNIHTWYIHTL